MSDSQSEHNHEESDCVFCKIVSGDLSSYKVYEDDDYFAFLDIKPFVYGHTLVVPKKHYRWVYDVEDFSGYWEIVKRVTHQLQKALKPKFVSYLTYGLDVPHAHIQVLPRNKSDESTLVPPTMNISKEKLEDIAQRLRNAL